MGLTKAQQLEQLKKTSSNLLQTNSQKEITELKEKVEALSVRVETINRLLDKFFAAGK